MRTILNLIIRKISEASGPVKFALLGTGQGRGRSSHRLGVPAERVPPHVSRMDLRTPPALSLHEVGAIRSGVRVLSGITAELPPGGVTALVGPSGSGKSSLLRLLNRLDDPSDGAISLDGEDLTELPVRDLRRRVGFVFQEPALFPGSVAENLRAALEVSELPVEDEEERLREALQEAELPDSFLTRPARELSGGEAQRVTLARALVLRPSALLLDEPTSALDPSTAERIVETIGEMSQRRGITIVVSTHRLDEARAMADFVLLLDSGRLVRCGPPGEVLGDGAGGGP